MMDKMRFEETTGIEARFHHRQGAFELQAALACPGRGVTAIAGPSGSGKSTLLRCIAGLEHPGEGFLAVNGAVWHDPARAIFTPAHQRPIGMVFQQANLFPHLSVRRNLEYGWRRIPAAERRIGFDQSVEMLGLAPLLGRDPCNLSGGEQQRVAIGRALLTSPRLLLMDEPLASLDQASRCEINPYLERLHTELAIPVLYVSHDPQEIARLADHVILMEAGRVVASGEMAEVITRLDLSLAHGEQALAVIDAAVAEHDQFYSLTTLSFPGGRLTLPRLPHPVGARVRAAILARDVSLALRQHDDSSILNIFPARVIEKTEGGDGHVLVRLAAGGVALLARITRKSAHMLGLLAGTEVFVQVKSVSILH